VDPYGGRLTGIASGHPAPLLLDGDRAPTVLGLPTAVPLGAVRYPRYESIETRIEPGSTLLLFTDGVVERAGENLDDGLARLAEAARGSEPAAVCRNVVDRLLPHGAVNDDAALMTAHIEPLGNPLELSLAAEIESIPLLRRVLTRWLADAGAGRLEADEIVLACSEATANAVEHAYGPSQAALSVSVSLEADRTVVVSVRDSGSWREPRAGSQGRGELLMTGLMDNVDVDRSPDGTSVRLARTLQGEAA
jgi:anti-sigma regulatory factor (Ser/Thr protein kinase)